MVSIISDNATFNFLKYVSITRFDSNGQLDLNFGNNGIVEFGEDSSDSRHVYSSVLQSDGKLLVSGDYETTHPGRDALMLKFHADLYTGVTDQFVRNFRIFPNPVTDYLTISSEKKGCKAEIEIYSSNGRKVKHLTLSIPDRIKIDDLLPGFYIIKINSENHSECFKIIKS